jgi:hypothetical protein
MVLLCMDLYLSFNFKVGFGEKKNFNLKKVNDSFRNGYS